jgi:hypothetical protein
MQPPNQPPYGGPPGYPPPGYPPQGYGPPGYPPPGYGPVGPQPHKGAQSAKTFGFLSILCGILAPVALIKGLGAKKEIAANPAAYTNPGDATVAIVIGGIVSGLLVLGVIINVANGGIRSSSSSSNSSPASLPFVSKAQANCERYKDAKNEIKKSEIFRENEDMLKDVELTDIKGTLKSISTSQGGADLSLRIEVGDVTFATEGLFAPIKKGSAVYKTASDMSEGQCVIFSASGLQANSVVEQSKVCDTDYFAKFTSLKSCK